MNITYISMSRIPSEQANTFQVIQMCDAFVSIGHRLVLLYPQRINTPAMAHIKDIYTYYGTANHFPLVSLPSIDFLWPAQRRLARVPLILKLLQERLFFPLMQISYFRSVRSYLKDRFAGILYLRDLSLVIYLMRKLPDLVPYIIFEAHKFPSLNWEIKWLPHLAKMGGVVTLTNYMKQLFCQAAVPADKILVAPDGVDLHRFEHVADKLAARQSLNLPVQRKIIGYTGHLYAWKGVATLVAAAHFLDDRYLICLVGGTTEDVADMRRLVNEQKLTKKVRVVGYVPPADIPTYLAAADILVLPNSGKQEINRYYTSPLKLFEYMAARRPIVASDLPAVREILNDTNAVFFRPDQPRDLAQKIQWLGDHPVETDALAQQGRIDVEMYTWQNRAKRIIEFASGLGIA
ncbi:MAG: glycosyltransferase family 4 protein [Anaerolineaceae bacterium]|nr:glycosyltransferase family 4 protein [Anaerolineaceae bacterium]